jgi:tetratricopeptide (TPR) repeat protein
MPKLLAILLLVFAAAAVAQNPDMPEIARSLMEEADRARDAGRVDEAIDKYARVIGVAPQLASAYINLGALQHKQGKVEDALATFARGVERAPADRTLLSNAAAAAQQLGRSADALAYVDRAVERNKRDAALHSLRGTILRALNREQDALAALEQAAQLAPRDSRIQFSLGNLLYAVGRKDESIIVYRKAADLDRSFLVAYYNLGAVLFDVGRYDEALKAYKVALEPIEQAFAKNDAVEPIHARAYANLGAIYLRQQQWAPAIDAYGKALRLDPNNAGAHYNLGFIHFTTNRDAPAEESYGRALALDPALPLAYLHLGQIAYRRGDFARAVTTLTEGKSRFEGESKIAALQTLGRAELGRGNRGAAAAAFEEVLRDKANDLESLVQLGRIYRIERKSADAAKLLEQAQRVAPDNRAVMLERALLAREGGDLTQERTLTEEILRREPNRADLWPLRANLVFIHLRQNNVAEARKQLDAVIGSAPPAQAAAVASLRSLRALLLAREGKFDEAQRDVAGSKSAVAALIDALAGRRDAAARTLLELPADPATRGDLGLVLWQLGRGADAKPHLAAAAPAWMDVNLAAGELALGEKNYDRAVELLTAAARCEATNGFAINGETLDVTLGKSELCPRAKQSLAIALLAGATDDLERLIRRGGEASSSGVRPAKQLVERALDLPLSERLQATAYFIRGSLDLLAGSTDAARESLARANNLGLPNTAENAARGYLSAIRENEEAQRAPDEAPEPSSATPRRTVVVFLPDAPADDKRIAEAMSAMISQAAAASGVALENELFRRADDARSFVAANRERVGIVVANTEFIGELNGFTPKFQFVREGSRSYRRVIVVPAASSIRSLADLRGKSVSVVEGLRDATTGTGANAVGVPDDLIAAANALYGKTDAAVVSEANPLLAQNASRLRIIHTTGAYGLPVVAFGAMPSADREALMTTFRSSGAGRALSTMQISGLSALERETRDRPQPKAIELTALSPAALGLTQTAGPPASVTYRVSLQLPAVAIPDDLFR